MLGETVPEELYLTCKNRIKDYLQMEEHLPQNEAGLFL